MWSPSQHQIRRGKCEERRLKFSKLQENARVFDRDIELKGQLSEFARGTQKNNFNND